MYYLNKRNMNVPLSKQAMIANVSSNFLEGLFAGAQAREANKQAQAKDEAERKAAADKETREWRRRMMEETYKSKLKRKENVLDKELEARLEQFKNKLPMTAQEEAEHEYKTGEERRSMQDKLAQAYSDIEVLKNESKLQQMLYDIEKANLKAKYAGKDPENMEQNEYGEVMKYFETLEVRLLKLMQTYRELEDEDGFKQANEELNKVRKRLDFLRQSHPYEQGLSAAMPQEPVEEKEEGGGVSGFLKDLGAEIIRKKEAFTKPEQPTVSREEINALKAQEPPRPSNFTLRKMSGGHAWFDDEDELDYLTWYVATHPDDLKAVRLYDKLRRMPERAWYFEGQQKPSGVSGN